MPFPTTLTTARLRAAVVRFQPHRPVKILGVAARSVASHSGVGAPTSSTLCRASKKELRLHGTTRAASTSQNFEGQLAALPEEVAAFSSRAIDLCRPSAVHIVTGSEDENKRLLDILVESGTMVKLCDKKRPGSYAGRSDPADVARSMQDTFICSESAADAGPTNNWAPPAEMKAKLGELFEGCMEGRTMYIVPFCMGPLDAPGAKFCVQVTDSPYVVTHLKITTRMGTAALERIQEKKSEFIQCVHSIGCPLTDEGGPGTEKYDKARGTWPCNITDRKITHFPETREVWSFGSGYGGNALLGKKCVALRIASAQARDEGWLAEHMLVLGITNPAGVKKYVAAAFPSACGKTNLAMMEPTLPGWKVETVGDDIAWIRFDEQGQLRAINPENGFFGVAPGTEYSTNPNAIKNISRNTIFTNVGITDDGDVYWEGMENVPTSPLTDWKGNKDWAPTLPDGTKSSPCAHPNSRFTTPLTQCPVLDDDWNSPQGVPIDAIIFGSRRDDTMPLVYQSFGWDHGVFIGATMRSNATSAAEQVGLVHDPMAMQPFIGYNAKDYFAHWLSIPDRAAKATPAGKEVKLPEIFHVNWFQRDDDFNFIWPGFGENSRVLKWILQRCDNEVAADTTAIGFVPKADGIGIDGINNIDAGGLAKITSVDQEKWRAEAAQLRRYFEEDLMKGCDVEVPPALVAQLDELQARLRSN